MQSNSMPTAHVMFFNPSLPFRDYFLNREFPVHVVYLANFLKERRGNEVNFGFLDMIMEWVRDPLIDPLNEDFLEKLVKDVVDRTFTFHRADAFIVVVSCHTTLQYLGARAFLRALRSLVAHGAIPRATIVVGGYHPSAVPEDFNDLGVDVIVVGEGEIALNDIISTARRVDDGDPREKEPMPRIIIGTAVLNLDDIPPVDFSIYESYLPLYPRLSIALSRGCPKSCAFCGEFQQSRHRPKWRAYSPQRAREEIRAVVGASDEFIEQPQDSRIIGFYDPTFGYAPRWRDKIVDFLVGSQTGYMYWAQTRIDTIARDEISRFKQAGLKFMLGLESGSPRMLHLMRKTPDPAGHLAAIERIIHIAKEIDYGPLVLNLIFNFPGETPDTLAETFTFLDGLVNEHGSFNTSEQLYVMYPGDAVHADLLRWQKEHGTRLYRQGWWRERGTATCGEFIDASRTLPYTTALEIIHDGLKSVFDKCKERTEKIIYKFEYLRKMRQEDAKLAMKLERLEELNASGVFSTGIDASR